MQPMSEAQTMFWRPNLSEVPRSLRVIPVMSTDAVKWIEIAARSLSEPGKEDFARGVEAAMNLIRSELFLPLAEELPVQRILSCFSSATANRRAAKLSRILHLVHSYPGLPNLHKGLRFVTAALWASYAALNLEGEGGKVQGERISVEAEPVWNALGWKVARNQEAFAARSA
jgi:hypothetical protein